jgi:hypothetical protein
LWYGSMLFVRNVVQYVLSPYKSWSVVNRQAIVAHLLNFVRHDMFLQILYRNISFHFS